MNKQFKHYPKYKDSGVEWLGDIPSGWSITSLGSILELKSDKNRIRKQRVLYNRYIFSIR